MSAIRSIDERSAENEPTAPRRVKVRVRRKRSAPTDTAPVDVTRADTTILPTIKVVGSGETGPLTAPERPLTLVAVDGSAVHDRRAAEAEPVAAPTEAPPEAFDGTDATESTDAANVADAGSVYTAALLAPVIDMEPIGEPTASDGAESVSLVATEAAPDDATAEATDAEPSAPARRHPTLAVMAALSQRTEPATPTLPYAEPADTEAHTAPLRLRAARPTAPLDASDRLDVAALDDAPAGATDATYTTRAATPESASDTAPVVVAPEREATPASEAPAAQASGVIETPMPGVDTPEAQAPASDARASSSSHQMWWPQATKRRAAPETRPIGAVSDTLLDEDLEITAPRPTSRRAASSPGARPQVAPAAPKAATASAVSVVGASFARRASSARQRAAARRSPRAVALSWAAFGYAAISSVASLIAVIAALRSAAGPLAWAVFGWALALALIAGAGAAIGYLCVQLGRLRLATFALLLSQLGALVWALGLLGPRAALLALAPASAALALRGAGRISAVVVAVAWMALFIVDEVLTLAGALTPSLPLNGIAAALVDVAIPLVGLWLATGILVSLYSSRMRVVAHGRAVEHVALQTEAQLERLRTQTEDDAEALRRALAQALRGEQPERVYAHGALSVVADTVNELADRLIDLRYDRAERKRLESATRRLTRVIERAWLGLSWSWPDATGTILDDLLALLRTPPPADTPDLLDETAPTGQVVAPHLFRGWRAPEPGPPTSRADMSQASLPGSPSAPSQPSQPSLPSLWPSDPGVSLTDPLELPPSPRWRGPDALYDTSDRPGATER